MPAKAKRPCRSPGCRHTTTERHGYCEGHAHLATGWTQRRRGQSGRGGRPWRRIRDRILQRDRYLCQPCKRQGRITPATEVDHIVNREAGGTDADTNLEAICSACHKAKTARESQSGRG
ncbi:HNH endonuclease signature motif containing protein [Salinicola sp. JS01]|uniref:HNH endonuclease n=1 Tax=Salinicola sp. JS01 TaxID=3050071 RepID=UPI00255B9357|nr:HNH endonuclease signature motif containing protein [Salinicola sp. JS01]WIX32516.1 HNH endonuclease signature motif containing protein [Salinicola sp. JS01]